MSRIVASFVVLLLSTFSMAQASQDSFMPPNNLHQEDGLFTESNVSEQLFNSIIEKARDYYTPVVASYGANLVIDGDWSSSTVNAYASQQGNTWHIQMLGGLARRREVTPDGFALVICHELGHHLGGFPFSSWAANEGQSDYFATLSCARKIWQREVGENAKHANSVGDIPKEICDGSWRTRGQKHLCYRVLAASKSLATLLGGPGVAYDTPDLTRVKTTKNTHPNGQCRLDTMVAGASCGVLFDIGRIPQTEYESEGQTCTRSQGFIKGNRPLCWYKYTG